MATQIFVFPPVKSDRFISLFDLYFLTMTRKVEMPPELEQRIDELVTSGMFSTFQSAVEELVRIGLASMRGGRREQPPGSVPGPERPTVPDPSRDILQM